MLSALDLAVFVSYVLLLTGVGVYFTRQQKGLRSYLLADQSGSTRLMKQVIDFREHQREQSTAAL